MADLKGKILIEGGDGLSTTLTVNSGRLLVTAGEHEIGNWAVDKLAVRRRNNEFHFKVEGEELVIHVDDPVALAQEMGLGMGQVEREKGRKGKARRKMRFRRRAAGESSEPAAEPEPAVKAGPLSALMNTTAGNEQPVATAPAPPPHDPPPDPYEDPRDDSPSPPKDVMPEPIEISFDSVEEPVKEAAPQPEPPAQDQEHQTDFEILPLPMAFEPEPPAEVPTDEEEISQEAEAAPFDFEAVEQADIEPDEAPEPNIGHDVQPLVEGGDPGEPEPAGLQPVESVQPEPVATDEEPEEDPEAEFAPEPVLELASADEDEEPEADVEPVLELASAVAVEDEEPDAEVEPVYELASADAVEDVEPEAEWEPEPVAEPAAAVAVEDEAPAGPSLWKRIPARWKAAGAGALVLIVMGILVPNLLALLLFVAGMGTLFLAVAAKSESGAAVMPPAFFGTDMAIFSGIGMVVLSVVIMVVA